MKPFRDFIGGAAVLFTVLLSPSISLVISDNTPAPETTLSFPVFLRSRFNPRRLQANQSSSVLPLASSDKQLEPSLAFEHKANVSTKNITDITAPTNTSLLRKDSPGVLNPPTVEHTTARIPTVVQHDRESLTKNYLAGNSLNNDECGIDSGTGDEFPWIAVVEHGGPNNSSGRKRTVSKGVLIDRQHVLTTISSVYNSYPSWVVMSIRLGDAPTHRQRASSKGKRGRSRNSTLVRLPIGMVFLHENKDIALIRLAGDGVQAVSDHVRPICLPQEDHRLETFTISSHVCEQDLVPAASSAAHSKNASSSRRGSHSKLQPVKLVPSDECTRLVKPYGGRLVVKSFCGWENTTDTCTGPLGGPLVTKIRDRYHVVGLRSYLPTETEVDGSGLPSIYLRIGGFRKWILALIKSMHG